MPDNSASCYVEIPRLGDLGLKNDAKKNSWELLFSGVILKLPHKSFLNV